MKIIKSIFFTGFLYWLIAFIVMQFALSFVWPFLYGAGWGTLGTLIAITLFDSVLLYSNSKGVISYRKHLTKMSNGDENEIQIYLISQYNFTVYVEIIDELPVQFQKRDFNIKSKLSPAEIQSHTYILIPKERGEYLFGSVNVLVKSKLGLVIRRFQFENNIMLPVYPSFLQMRKYELLAISNSLTMSGIKKIRRIGNTTEFDQIKEYSLGDDYRTMNWKATGRRQKLMVNKYQDERSQNVYSLIDMGRIMQMPFEEMSLLDYSINSSLVISNVAWKKHDKPGIIAFNHKIQNFLAAERRGSQMFRIQETLYNLETNFLETDYERLCAYVLSKINQRSLFLLFTNFETLSGLKRQLKYLRKIASSHLLIVVFFENTELKEVLKSPAKNTKEIYFKTVGEKFELDKKLIQRELLAYGIQSIYTSPQNLTVNTINKYLEIKSRSAM